MNQEMLSGQLPPIDERERGILFSILLMLNLFAALAQTGLATWFLLSNLLNYPANLSFLLVLVIYGFYLASVLGLLHWKKWAFFSYIGITLLAIVSAFFLGQLALMLVQILQGILFLTLSLRKFNFFD
jgi:hypothetical protein